MHSVTPHITKIIRNDPFLYVRFNCPLANREIIDEINGSTYEIISYGNVKYHRINVNKRLVAECHKSTMNTTTQYTAFESNETFQYPAAYIYLRSDLAKQIDVEDDKDTYDLRLQLAAYLSEFFHSYYGRLVDVDGYYMVTVKDIINEEVFKITDKEICDYIRDHSLFDDGGTDR